MQTEQTESQSTSTGKCPIDHSTLPRQKTAWVSEPDAAAPVERDAQGVWQVRGFAQARAILRDAPTQQAGFRAEQINTVKAMRAPILYQEGKPHQEQRRQTARFFTPKAVSDNYRQLMEDQATQLVAELQRNGQGDLSQLALTMAMGVVAQVLGLTNSRRSRMDRRITAFFVESRESRNPLLRRVQQAQRVSHVANFFFTDVRPAIRVRKRQPREDLISHLISQGRTEPEILTECITFAAAGIVTTREFITVAAWHLLEHPDLRARYLAAPEAERQQILHEMLRVEPVVGHLFRRATEDVQVKSAGDTITIPQGDLIDLRLYAVNADRHVVGEDPLAICPGRPLAGDNIPPQVMSFGDGHHRCPGAYIAIQESDIFLQRLLAIPTLQITRPPTMQWSPIAAGFELRDFRVRV